MQVLGYTKNMNVMTANKMCSNSSTTGKKNIHTHSTTKTEKTVQIHTHTHVQQRKIAKFTLSNNKIIEKNSLITDAYTLSDRRKYD